MSTLAAAQASHGSLCLSPHQECHIWLPSSCGLLKLAVVGQSSTCRLFPYIRPGVCLKPTCVLSAIGMSFVQLIGKAWPLLITLAILCLINNITKNGDIQGRGKMTHTQRDYFSLAHAKAFQGRGLKFMVKISLLCYH